MFQDPILTHDSIVAEQKRIDRANELHRMVADHPERIVSRRSVLSRVRGWFRTGRPVSVASGTRAPAESAARPMHAR